MVLHKVMLLRKAVITKEKIQGAQAVRVLADPVAAEGRVVQADILEVLVVRVEVQVVRADMPEDLVTEAQADKTVVQVAKVAKVASVAMKTAKQVFITAVDLPVGQAVISHALVKDLEKKAQVRVHQEVALAKIVVLVDDQLPNLVKNSRKAN